MPAHYGLSDAVIMLVAIWGAVALSKERRLLPAFSMACFGIPAAIGVVRFGAGLQGELAPLHAGASQLLGLAGAAALAAFCLQRTGGRRDSLLAAAILMAAGLVFFFTTERIAPLFILALTVALCAALLRAARTRSDWLTSAGLALLLANALVIRRAQWLSEEIAWHGYHLLIALALAMVAMGIRRKERS